MADVYDPFLDGDESSQELMMDHDFSSPQPDLHDPSDLMLSIEYSQSRQASSSESQELKSQSDSSSSAMRALSVSSSSVKEESEESYPNGLSHVDDHPTSNGRPQTNGNGHFDEMDTDDQVVTPRANAKSRSRPVTRIPRTSIGLISPTMSYASNATNGSHTSHSIDQLADQQSSLHLDGDDDFMVISPCSPSPEARRQLGQAQVRSAPSARDDHIIVKDQPNNDVLPDAPPVHKPAPKPKPDFRTIMAAQRTLLAHMNKSGGSSSVRSASALTFPSVPSSTSHQDRSESMASEIGAPPQQPAGAASRDSTRDFREMPAEVEQAMRGVDDDHSWMHDDLEGEDEYDTLLKLRDTLTKREERNTITPT